MAAQTAIPIEEYLHTSYEGTDREFRDGEVIERSWPDSLHGKSQMLLGAFFMALRKRLHLHPRSETRLRLPNRRVLIPDVAVFHPSEPPLLPVSPPLVAIEILSPDDRFSEVRSKLEEYRAWGVPHVCLVDPHSRRLFNYDRGLHEAETLRIEELGLELTPADAFD